MIIPEVSIHPSCSGSPHNGLSVGPVPMDPMKGSVAAISSRYKLIRLRKCQGSGVKIPFCDGSSVCWLAVCAQRIGMLFSKITAALLRDTTHARMRPKPAGRNMTAVLGLRETIESRVCSQD